MLAEFAQLLLSSADLLMEGRRSSTELGKKRSIDMSKVADSNSDCVRFRAKVSDWRWESVRLEVGKHPIQTAKVADSGRKLPIRTAKVADSEKLETLARPNELHKISETAYSQGYKEKGYKWCDNSIS